MSAKAQAWTTDFIVGFLIFMIAMILITKLIFNTFLDDSFEVVYSEGQELSELLMTSGFPRNWTNSSVFTPGIVDSSRLNLTKLDEFRKISYDRSKGLLGIKSDYFYFFTKNDSILNISGELGQGHPAASITNNSVNITETYKNLIKIERFVVHDATIVSMILYVWD